MNVSKSCSENITELKIMIEQLEDREIKRQYQLRESVSLGANRKTELLYHQERNENSFVDGQK